jgi:hypothetical protein
VRGGKLPLQDIQLFRLRAFGASAG